MTMIACTINRNVPVVMADILISGDQQPEKFILPSHNENILDFMDSRADFHPVMLLRKIYISKSNVCVAFAGDVATIKKFLEDLVIFCKAHPSADAFAMQQFCFGYGLKPGDDIAFLMVVADIVNEEYRFLKMKYGDWNETQSPIFGDVMAAGSGAEDFILETMEAANYLSGFPQDSIEIALQSNVILLCRLLSLEHISLRNTKNYWGAGFEMVYLMRQGFTFFDNITYIINHAAFDNTGGMEIPIPAIIMHYQYVDETLVITAINPQQGTTEVKENFIIIRYTEFKVKQFIVDPIYGGKTVDTDAIAADTSFTANRIAMGYVITTPAGDFLPASFNVGPELLVEYKHLESVTIRIRKEMNDALADLSKQWYEGMHF